jgi:hypothetical protein
MPIVKETPFLRDIITGWNEKLKLSNVELSNLSPFVQLYALYDVNSGTRLNNNDPTRVRNNEPIVTLLREPKRAGDVVEIQVIEPSGDDDVTFNYVGVELAKLESQVASSSLKGGAGIQSLRVNRGTREAFTSKFDIDMVVTDVDMIKEKIEYSSLNTLNQDFLIVYGWRNALQGVINPPPTPEVVGGTQRMSVRLDRSNKGYWMAAVVSLQKFNFSLGQENHLIVKLNFLSSRISRLAFRRTQDFARNVLRDLQTPNFGSSVAPDRAKKIYDAIRADAGHSISSEIPAHEDPKIYVVSSAAGLRTTSARLQELSSIAKRIDDNGGRSGPTQDDTGVIPGKSYSQQIAEQRGGRKAQLIRARRSAIQNDTDFKKQTEDYINDISIEVKRLNFYLGVTDSEEGFGDRSVELASQRLNRLSFIDAYITNVILDLNSIVAQPTIISLSELRQIVSNFSTIVEPSGEETSGIGNVEFGSIFGGTIISDPVFLANNPLYNRTRPVEQGGYPKSAGEFVAFPRSSVITIKMNSKRIRVIPPNPVADVNGDNDSDGGIIGFLTDTVETINDNRGSRRQTGDLRPGDPGYQDDIRT